MQNIIIIISKKLFALVIIFILCAYSSVVFIYISFMVTNTQILDKYLVYRTQYNNL